MRNDAVAVDKKKEPRLYSVSTFVEKKKTTPVIKHGTCMLSRDKCVNASMGRSRSPVERFGVIKVT